MKKRIFRYFLGVSISISLICILPVSWAAEKYPSRSVELVCGMGPGSAPDVLNRIFARYMEKYLGVPVVPTNKPGASQIMAATYLANSRPDGYTIANMGNQIFTAILSGQATTFSLEDLRIVCQINSVCNTLAVTADSPWKTFQDFIDYARKNPGVKYGNPGIGSGPHLRMEAVSRYAKLGLIAIPFKAGDGEVIPAVLGKHLPIGMISAGGALTQAAAGNMRILFSFDPPGDFGLDPATPHLRSVFGKDVPDLYISGYLWVQKKTPDEIVQVLEKVAEKMSKDQEFVSEIRKNNFGVKFVDSKTVKETLPEYISQMKDMLRYVGLMK